MGEYISFDSHKRYTLVEHEDHESRRARQCRLDHAPGAIERYLRTHGRPGTPVAVEAVGNWYWIIDEIEQAGHLPRLVHPRKAKLMMGMINKTDKLDVHGLNRLQRNGVLPTVWIPPNEIRDLRELTRARMRLSHDRTKVKNRLTSTLEKYNRGLADYPDTFAKKARPALEQAIAALPPQTQTVAQLGLAQLDLLTTQIQDLEKRIKSLVQETPEMTRLKTMPGIGDLLAAVIALEIGDVSRFASAERLASYAGTTPRVHSSGGKTSYGKTRPDVNRYLKWALAEAANSVAVNASRKPERHVSQLYRKLRSTKPHGKAVGAVSRHLAEACFYVLTKKEPYRDPALGDRQGAGASAILS